ncbi:MAG: hypothetical protein ACR2QZ_03635 [Woeseiaceae bacterium]
MRKSIIRGALLSILLLGITIPGVALAGGGGKGCSNIGTWFGVAPFPLDPTSPPVELPPPPWDDKYLTGWSVSVMGKSNNKGTNHFEYPVFDPTLAILGLNDTPPFSDAVRIGSMRGNWKRTGGNTFDYTFMGFAFDASSMPVYIAKISGQVVLVERCRYQYTTAIMEVFRPWMRPFQDDPEWEIPLGEFYGYRAKVDLPY